MATYSFTLDPEQFDNGDYQLEIIAVDNSSNQNVTDTDPINFTVTNGTIQVPSSSGRPTIEVDIAFRQAPFTVSPDWTDVTDDVLMASGVTITRGASADNPSPTAGTISFTLVDRERKYDPENGDGPYYGGFTYGCPCRVVANYLNLPVKIVTGRAISNPDPIVSSGTTSVPLAYGYIDGFPQTYTAADTFTTVAIEAPDALSILARTSFLPVHPFTAYDDAGEGVMIVTATPISSALPLVPGLAPPDYTLADVAIVGDPQPDQPAERSGARIRTLCELAGIPTDFLNIDTGQTIIEGGVPQESNLLDHFRTVTATEYGRFYQARDGRLRFIERRSALRRLTVSQALFCEAGGLGLPYADLTLDPADRRFLVNRAIRSSQSVEQVLVQDQHSIAKYGVFEDNQTLAFADPQDAIDQATHVVALFADAPCRVTSLTLRPDRSPSAMFPTVIQMELGNRYTVSRTPLGQGDPIVKIVTVEKITHQFDQVSWTTTVDLGQADTTPYFTADDSVLGLVDAGNIVAY